jgi:phage terminase large subunit
MNSYLIPTSAGLLSPDSWQSFLQGIQPQPQTTAGWKFPSFRNNAQRLQESNDTEIILTGPTRTGKTLACLSKVWQLMTENDGLRALVVRKQRTDLSETALVTLERDLIGTSHPMLVNGPKRQYRSTYTLTNGSTLVCGGLDRPGKIMSSEYDIICVPQAEELSSAAWETLITRLSGTVLPPHQQQIIGDCNPASPLHWIMQRSLSEMLNLWETYHKDNPLLYDGADWTVFGAAYLDRLSASLTGNERARLLDGKWVQNEGVVYKEFGTDNLTDAAPDPALPVELAVDDGYVDPRAILFIQRTGTQVHIFDELYHSGHLDETCVGEAVDKCVEYFGWKDEDGEIHTAAEAEALQVERAADGAEPLVLVPAKLPQLVVGSPEAKELQRRFRSAGMPFKYKAHKVVEGIKVVRGVIQDGNKYRALQVNKRCRNFISELTDGYRYPELGTRNDSEKPLDGNDHACDAFRYWAWVRVGKGLEGKLLY